MMQRTACTVARLHAVPVPDTPHGLQPQLWLKIAGFMGSLNGVYQDPHKTRRYIHEHYVHSIPSRTSGTEMFIYIYVCPLSDRLKVYVKWFKGHHNQLHTRLERGESYSYPYPYPHTKQDGT